MAEEANNNIETRSVWSIDPKTGLALIVTLTWCFTVLFEITTPPEFTVIAQAIIFTYFGAKVAEARR